jgi:hypothetical protein
VTGVAVNSVHAAPRCGTHMPWRTQGWPQSDVGSGSRVALPRSLSDRKCRHRSQCCKEIERRPLTSRSSLSDLWTMGHVTAMRYRRWVPAVVAISWVAGCAYVPAGAPKSQQAVTSAAAVLAEPFRSAAEDPKDGPCIKTTHGCVALNPDVEEGTIDVTICVPGYAKSVRPATSYTDGVKKKLMREAGIDVARIGDYELDHIVPLALGGHPRKPSNLMLQTWEGERGAKAKDVLEARVQSLVCHGKLDLTDAQVCIAQDWEACAARYPRR